MTRANYDKGRNSLFRTVWLAFTVGPVGLNLDALVL